MVKSAALPGYIFPATPAFCPRRSPREDHQPQTGLCWSRSGRRASTDASEVPKQTRKQIAPTREQLINPSSASRTTCGRQNGGGNRPKRALSSERDARCRIAAVCGAAIGSCGCFSELAGLFKLPFECLASLEKSVFGTSVPSGLILLSCFRE